MLAFVRNDVDTLCAIRHDRELVLSAAVARAVAEGWRFLELTAMTEDQLDALGGFLAHTPEELARFKRVSLHAPVARLRSSTAALADKIASIGHEFDTVFHPDLYANTPSLRRLEQRLIF